MEEWKKRLIHHEDVTQVLREGGELDQQGRLRKWFGKKSVDRLLSVGHSSVGYEQCSCSKE